MKKILALAMAAVMALSLVACGGGDSSATSDGPRTSLVYGMSGEPSTLDRPNPKGPPRPTAWLP